MAKVSWKPGTMLFPLPPVMVTCGTLEKPNVLTIAWTGIINSEPPMTYISVRPTRYSHKIIKENKELQKQMRKIIEHCISMFISELDIQDQAEEYFDESLKDYFEEDAMDSWNNN